MNRNIKNIYRRREGGQNDDNTEKEDGTTKKEDRTTNDNNRVNRYIKNRGGAPH